MKYSKSSYRYAKALMSLAVEKNLLEDIKKDITLIHKTYTENTELKTTFDSSIVNVVQKKNISIALFSNKVNEISLNFLSLVIEKKRSNNILEITDIFLKLYDEKKALAVAKVTTAFPLNDDLKSIVSKKANELTGKTVEIVNIIDKNIIGGFILKVGDLQYNASISNKIKNLKKEFNHNLFVS